MFEPYESLDALLKDYETCRVCGQKVTGAAESVVRYRRFFLKCAEHYIVEAHQYKHNGKTRYKVRQQGLVCDDVVLVRRRGYKPNQRHKTFNQVVVQTIPAGKKLEANWIYYVRSESETRPTRTYPWGKFKRAFQFTDPVVFKEKIKRISKTIFML